MITAKYSNLIISLSIEEEIILRNLPNKASHISLLPNVVSSIPCKGIIKKRRETAVS